MDIKSPVVFYSVMSSTYKDVNEMNIIVSKRTNTRLFKKSGAMQINSKPGTVFDREITFPGRNE
jgi:hypothetical protein